MALELNDGGGKGLVYPFLLGIWDSFDGVRDKDDLRGGTSFGGNGGGDDIVTCICRIALLSNSANIH